MPPPEYLKSNFIPRSYQLELLSKSKKKNTIAFLNTGTGKTYISILLIKEKSKDVFKEWDEGGKRTFFIVNSVPLVHQQGNYIKEHTNLSVGQYTGSMAVDYWKEDQWNIQFRQFQVLVMTAQIFLNILNHGFLKLSRVNLLVFDECHHAIKNHPYKKIMELVMDEQFCSSFQRPHILGLTASVINNKCSYSKINENVKKLELVLNSSVQTSQNINDIYKYSTKPKEFIYIFQLKAHPCHSWLDKHILTPLNNAINTFSLFMKRDKIPNSFVENERDVMRNNHFNLHITVLKQLYSITLLYGPWSALMAARIFNRDLYKMQTSATETISKNGFSFVISLVTSIIMKLNPIITPDFSMKDIILFSTTKLQTLIKVLEIYALKSQQANDGDGGDHATKTVDKKKSHFTAIIFVETRFTAILINLFLNSIAKLSDKLSFIRSGYIIGHGMQSQKKICEAAHMLHKGQQTVLNKFRQGEINVLVGTRVVEEGIDIPKCNLVIRFDLPQNFRSYVQSKGRARAINSHYIIMVADAFKKNLFADLRDYTRIEKSLFQSCVDREGPTDTDSTLYHKLDELLPPYQPVKGEGKPRVTLTSAIALVNWYCTRLPSDSYTTLYPKCKTKKVEVRLQESDTTTYKFQTTIKLPINSVLKMPIVGQAMENVKFANMAAALKCCEMLHVAGELNDHLLPFSKDCYAVERDLLSETVPDGAPLPGSIKRKQIYFKKIAQCLTSALPISSDVCFLYEVEMVLQTPTPHLHNTHGRKLYYPERYPRNIAILTRKHISLIPQFPIYTRAGEVIVNKKLICSNLTLSESQLQTLTQFHQYMFEKVIRITGKNMIFDMDKSKCNILLTVIGENKAIDYSFIDFVFNESAKPLPNLKDPNRPAFYFQRENFVDKVVSPIYRHFEVPIYFFVAEIIENMTPLSPFPKNGFNYLHSTDSSSQCNNLETFVDYYQAKYEISITDRNQSLLDVDHTVGRLNLLSPRFMTKQGTFLPASSSETKNSKRLDINQKQILIPELCRVHPFDTPLWHKTVCIPTILHRVNYFLVCDELRCILSRDVDLGPETLNEEDNENRDIDKYPILDFGWRKICEDQLNDMENHNIDLDTPLDQISTICSESKNIKEPFSSNEADEEIQVFEMKITSNHLSSDNITGDIEEESCKADSRQANDIPIQSESKQGSGDDASNSRPSTSNGILDYSVIDDVKSCCTSSYLDFNCDVDGNDYDVGSGGSCCDNIDLYDSNTMFTSDDTCSNSLNFPPFSPSPCPNDPFASCEPEVSLLNSQSGNLNSIPTDTMCSNVEDQLETKYNFTKSSEFTISDSPFTLKYEGCKVFKLVPPKTQGSINENGKIFTIRKTHHPSASGSNKRKGNEVWETLVTESKEGSEWKKKIRKELALKNKEMDESFIKDSLGLNYTCMLMDRKQQFFHHKKNKNTSHVPPTRSNINNSNKYFQSPLQNQFPLNGHN